MQRRILKYCLSKHVRINVKNKAFHKHSLYGQKQIMLKSTPCRNEDRDNAQEHRLCMDDDKAAI